MSSAGERWRLKRCAVPTHGCDERNCTRCKYTLCITFSPMHSAACLPYIYTVKNAEASFLFHLNWSELSDRRPVTRI